MPEVLPDQREARRLVVSVGLFWGAWGLSFVGLFLVPALTPVGLFSFLIAWGAGLTFFFTLCGLWEGETGESPWRLMFMPGFSGPRRRARLHVMIDPLRPRWIKHTLRETGWPVARVAYLLLGLLVVDLVLLAVAP